MKVQYSFMNIKCDLCHTWNYNDTIESGTKAIRKGNTTKMKKLTTGVLIAMMSMAITSCGTTTGNRNAEVQTTQEVTAAPTIEPTEEPKVLIELKKKAEVTSDVNMKVNSVSKKKKITSDIWYYKPQKENHIFAIVNVTLKNTTDESTAFSLEYFQLIGPNDEEYIPTLIDNDNMIIINHFMDANYKETGCLVFEVPKDTKVKNCKLRYNSSGIPSNTYFKLK